MPYVSSDGNVVEKRTMFRLSIFSDAFWAVADFVALFVRTLINPNTPIKRRVTDQIRPTKPSDKSGSSSSGTYQRKGPNIKTLPKASECSTGS
eukprot:gene5013-7000_t